MRLPPTPCVMFVLDLLVSLYRTCSLSYSHVVLHVIKQHILQGSGSVKPTVVHEGAVVPEGRGARPAATAAWKSVSLRAVAK